MLAHGTFHVRNSDSLDSSSLEELLEPAGRVGVLENVSKELGVKCIRVRSYGIRRRTWTVSRFSCLVPNGVDMEMPLISGRDREQVVHVFPQGTTGVLSYCSLDQIVGTGHCIYHLPQTSVAERRLVVGHRY